MILLCSRNALPQKALVGRAQWETKQAALRERRVQARKDGIESHRTILLARKTRTPPVPFVDHEAFELRNEARLTRLNGGARIII